MSAETIGSAAVPDENRLPGGFGPLACRWQEVRPRVRCVLAVQMTRIIAPAALTTLGLSGAPVHARGPSAPVILLLCVTPQGRRPE
jgi:hypothetical protein